MMELPENCTECGQLFVPSPSMIVSKNHKCRSCVVIKETRARKLRKEAGRLKPRAETPRRRYKVQKCHAKKRGIPFELTFDEWWRIWQESGRWEERGSRSGQYVMARFGDRGPYAVGNVKIIPCNENTREITVNRRLAKEAA